MPGMSPGPRPYGASAWKPPGQRSGTGTCRRARHLGPGGLCRFSRATARARPQPAQPSAGHGTGSSRRPAAGRPGGAGPAASRPAAAPRPPAGTAPPPARPGPALAQADHPDLREQPRADVVAQVAELRAGPGGGRHVQAQAADRDQPHHRRQRQSPAPPWPAARPPPPAAAPSPASPAAGAPGSPPPARAAWPLPGPGTAWPTPGPAPACAIPRRSRTGRTAPSPAAGTPSPGRAASARAAPGPRPHRQPGRRDRAGTPFASTPIPIRSGSRSPLTTCRSAPAHAGDPTAMVS